MYKKAINIDQKDHRIRINCAASQALMGSWDLATKELEKAIELDIEGYDKDNCTALLDIIANKNKEQLEIILI